MITPEYCRTMARYNQWQNKSLMSIVARLDEDDLRADRGAFFGSILGTLNHLLWGDLIWIARFDGGEPPEATLQDSPEITPHKTEWARMRFLTDGRIREWARRVDAVDLVGDLNWYSVAYEKDMSVPLSLGVMQLFNHQTHHRGQVHAMLTALGHDPGSTDLPFMPEEI